MIAPIIRIVLRYVVGGLMMGSIAMGEQFAADPDIVITLSAAVGVVVEGFWIASRKLGWNR
jgi:hypothetical protein